MSTSQTTRARRRAQWNPPATHQTFVHDADGTVWTVKHVDLTDRQVHIYCAVESRHRFVSADELERDYTRVERAS